MVISNVELAALIGELTGSKITSMSYGAALAVSRDDSEPCTVADVAELLCSALHETFDHNDPIYPLPEVNSETWNKEWR